MAGGLGGKGRDSGAYSVMVDSSLVKFFCC